MGKIKGWSKTYESKNKKKIIFGNNNSEIIYGQTFEGYWIVIINKEFKKSFTTKAQAKAYATKYMRSHPNG